MLDFYVYQGPKTFSNQKQGIGVASVLCMVGSIPKGSYLFFDQYFRTINLMDTLLSRGFPATGTLMSNRVPEACKLPGDKVIERGVTVSVVRKNPELAITKWYDNKAVLMASTVHRRDPEDICNRWSKK